MEEIQNMSLSLLKSGYFLIAIYIFMWVLITTLVLVYVTSHSRMQNALLTMIKFSLSKDNEQHCFKMRQAFVVNVPRGTEPCRAAFLVL